MLRSLSSGLSQAVQECRNASVRLKTSSGFSQLSLPKSPPSTLICPVILYQLASHADTDAVHQLVWSPLPALTLTHAHADTYTRTCTHYMINPQTEMHSPTVPSGTEPSPWLMLGGLIHWIIQVQQMHQAGKCHWYLVPFLVWSTTPTIKQCIWVMLALQVARRQCLNSPATGVSICMYSYHLAWALPASLSHSHSPFHSRLSNLLFRLTLCWTAIDHWCPCPQAVWMEMGFMCVNVSVMFQTTTQGYRVGVLKLFGSTFTATLMILTVKSHLTSSVQLAYLNYLELEFLMLSNGAVMEPLP